MAVWIVLVLLTVGGVSGDNVNYPRRANGPSYNECGSGRVAVSLCGSQGDTNCGTPASNGRVSSHPSYAVAGCGDFDWFMEPNPRTSGALGSSRWICSKNVGTYLRCNPNEVMTGVCGSGSGTDCNRGRANGFPGGGCWENARLAVECTALGPGFEISNQRNGPDGAGNREFADCSGKPDSGYRQGRNLNKVLCGACLSGSGKDCGDQRRKSNGVLCTGPASFRVLTNQSN